MNDIAMKVADVGDALLNGYGHEVADNRDFGDEPRREQLFQRKIGSNRLRRSKTESLTGAGIGSSAAASCARMKAE